MRNYFFAIMVTAALFSCNDDAEKTENLTGDSTTIESSMDTSSATMQADTMPKQTVDTTTAVKKKPGKTKK